MDFEVTSKNTKFTSSVTLEEYTVNFLEDDIIFIDNRERRIKIQDINQEIKDKIIIIVGAGPVGLYAAVRSLDYFDLVIQVEIRDYFTRKQVLLFRNGNDGNASWPQAPTTAYTSPTDIINNPVEYQIIQHLLPQHQALVHSIQLHTCREFQLPPVKLNNSNCEISPNLEERSIFSMQTRVWQNVFFRYLFKSSKYLMIKVNEGQDWNPINLPKYDSILKLDARGTSIHKIDNINEQFWHVEQERRQRLDNYHLNNTSDIRDIIPTHIAILCYLKSDYEMYRFKIRQAGHQHREIKNDERIQGNIQNSYRLFKVKNDTLPPDDIYQTYLAVQLNEGMLRSRIENLLVDYKPVFNNPNWRDIGRLISWFVIQKDFHAQITELTYEEILNGMIMAKKLYEEKDFIYKVINLIYINNDPTIKRYKNFNWDFIQSILYNVFLQYDFVIDNPPNNRPAEIDAETLTENIDKTNVSSFPINIWLSQNIYNNDKKILRIGDTRRSVHFFSGSGVNKGINDVNDFFTYFNPELLIDLPMNHRIALACSSVDEIWQTKFTNADDLKNELCEMVSHFLSGVGGGEFNKKYYKKLYIKYKDKYLKLKNIKKLK